MKKLTALLFAMFAIQMAFSQTTVPNGDFENWTDETHILNWDGLNYDGTFLNFHTFSRTSDAHTGNYAAQVETIHHDLMGDLPGIAFTGNVNVNPTSFEYTLELGIPVEGRPSSLNGFFKYNPSGGDTMAIVVAMFRWDEQEMNLDSIGGGLFFTGDVVDSYTEFVLPIQYFDPVLEADTMYVMMFSSLDSYHVGSVLKVDDLNLNYGPLGVEDDVVEVGEILIYPNPAIDYIKVEMSDSYQINEFQLFDISGRIILNHSFKNSLSIPLSSNIPDGMYVAHIKQNGMVIKTRKVIVKGSL